MMMLLPFLAYVEAIGVCYFLKHELCYCCSYAAVAADVAVAADAAAITDDDVAVVSCIC